MGEIMWLILTPVFLVIAGACVFFVAYNVPIFGVAWCILFGALIITGCIGRYNKTSQVMLTFGSVLLILFVVLRSAPMHSLHWGKIDKITIKSLRVDGKIEVNDPGSLKVFAEFGKRGSYSTVMKGLNLYHVNLYSNGRVYEYYACGDALGKQETPFTRTVFVPAKDGLFNWLENEMKKRGIDEEKEKNKLLESMLSSK